MARWLVNRGARHLVLLSRSGARSVEATELVNELHTAGVQVATPGCDVSDLEALKRIFAELAKSMPPVKGCIQASMVLQVSLRICHTSKN